MHASSQTLELLQGCRELRNAVELLRQRAEAKRGAAASEEDAEEAEEEAEAAAAAARPMIVC